MRRARAMTGMQWRRARDTGGVVRGENALCLVHNASGGSSTCDRTKGSGSGNTRGIVDHGQVVVAVHVTK